MPLYAKNFTFAPWCYHNMWLARQMGIITNATKCTLCGIDKIYGKTIYAHHFDYAKPFDIIWCCAKCHYKIHFLLIQGLSEIFIIYTLTNRWIFPITKENKIIGI